MREKKTLTASSSSFITLSSSTPRASSRTFSTKPGVWRRTCATVFMKQVFPETTMHITTVTLIVIQLIVIVMCILKLLYTTEVDRNHKIACTLDVICHKTPDLVEKPNAQ